MSEVIYIWMYLSLGKILNIELFVMAVAGFAAWLFFYGMSLLEDIEESAERFAKNFPKKVFLIWFILCCFYPSTDDLKYMIGGSLVINGVEAAKDIDGVSDLPANMVGAMNHFLESVSEKEIK